MNARVTTTAPNYAAVDIQAILIRLARQHAPAALAAVLAAWPVESGTSRAGWEVAVIVDGPQAVRIVLRNTVAYAEYVTRPGGDTPIAPPLALEAMRAAQAALDAEAAIEIARALREAPRRTK
jgi:hypothetical protein